MADSTTSTSACSRDCGRHLSRKSQHGRGRREVHPSLTDVRSDALVLNFSPTKAVTHRAESEDRRQPSGACMGSCLSPVGSLGKQLPSRTPEASRVGRRIETWGGYESACLYRSESPEERTFCPGFACRLPRRRPRPASLQNRCSGPPPSPRIPKRTSVSFLFSTDGFR